MNILFTKYTWKLAAISIYDIATFLQRPDEHMDHTQSAIVIMYDMSMTLSLEKFEFIPVRIEYLEHVFCLEPLMNRLDPSMHFA